jgi:hypothetical protein
MKFAWVSLLVCVVLMTPSELCAQVAVRLEVERDTWLSESPINLKAELTAKLKNANIVVTDRPDAPVVIFRYEERPARGYAPYLVPATVIVLNFEISSDKRRVFLGMPPVTAKLLKPGQEFPSAIELRSRSLEALKIDPMFSMAGHVVGAALGLEASFRALMSGEVAGPSQPTVSFLLFSALTWTPENDDLFDQAIQQMARSHVQSSVWIEEFLLKQLPAFQQVDGPAPGSLFSSMAILGEFGTKSAIELVQSIRIVVKDPRVVELCEATLERMVAQSQK